MRKGFVLNGQLDNESKLSPSMMNLLHTYCGDITDTCLADPKWIINCFFEDMFTNGAICEDSFDKYSIPKDKTFCGMIVEKQHGVSQENCQCAKVFSSPAQIYKCKKFIHEKRLSKYHKQMHLYEQEDKEFQLNIMCKKSFMQS